MDNNATKIFVEELLLAITTSTDAIVDQLEIVIKKGDLLAPEELPAEKDIVLNYNGDRYAYSKERTNLGAYEDYVASKADVKTARSEDVQTAVEKYKASIIPVVDEVEEA